VAALALCRVSMAGGQLFDTDRGMDTDDPFEELGPILPNSV
jgi:hypothetical protein